MTPSRGVTSGAVKVLEGDVRALCWLSPPRSDVGEDHGCALCVCMCVQTWRNRQGLGHLYVIGFELSSSNTQAYGREATHQSYRTH